MRKKRIRQQTSPVWLRRICWPVLVSSFAAAASLIAQAPPEVTSWPALVEQLPVFLPAPGNAKANTRLFSVLERASLTEKRDALPVLLRWADGGSPDVRAFALGLIYVSTLPSAPSETLALPPEEIGRIAAHLVDESGVVRDKAALALSSTVYTETGRAEVTRHITPLLRDPKMLQQVPDPFFTAGNAFMLAHTPPQQRAALERIQQQQKVFLLPAVGPIVLGLLLHGPTNPSTEQAILAFLDRDDQTAATLSDSLHVIALTHAPELIQNEALTRVFDKGAMSVFLMQFLGSLSLTPEHLQQQRTRLVHFASDSVASPQTRHAASSVAACWGEDRHTACRPDDADFQEERHPAEQVNP